MVSLGTLREFVRCTRCGQSTWEEAPRGFQCSGCGLGLTVDQGVLRPDAGTRDAATEYYAYTGGPRFIDATFASNPVIYFTTRAYRRHLDGWFPAPTGALLDLGCGDGRMALWALERGFAPVFAVDSGLAGLQRLAAAARERGLRGLVPLCASLQDRCLRSGVFDVALLFETLSYLPGNDGYAQGLGILHDYLKPGTGRAVVADLCRDGRVLVEAAAMDLENLRKLAYEDGRRWEKYDDRAVEVRYLTPAALAQACEAAGLRVRARGGVSPIPALFNFARTFTSYPLRPALDDRLRVLLEALDDQASAELSPLSRNMVLLLDRA
jgi:SAM-dependent methyltransferase